MENNYCTVSIAYHILPTCKEHQLVFWPLPDQPKAVLRRHSLLWMSSSEKLEVTDGEQQFSTPIYTLKILKSDYNLICRMLIARFWLSIGLSRNIIQLTTYSVRSVFINDTDQRLTIGIYKFHRGIFHKWICSTPFPKSLVSYGFLLVSFPLVSTQVFHFMNVPQPST